MREEVHIASGGQPFSGRSWTNQVRLNVSGSFKRDTVNHRAADSQIGQFAV